MLNETVWLTQDQMAKLFHTTKQNISKHVKNIFIEGELQQNSVVKDLLTTADDGKNYQTAHYNLDMIISVGYRVNSRRGTEFRIWATGRLKEYIIKGYAVDERRLQETDQIDKLVEYVRSIRTSEKAMYRKITDIFATSKDNNTLI